MFNVACNIGSVGAGSARPRLYRVLVIPTKRSAEGSLPHILIPSLRERVRERLRRVAVSPPLTHTPHRCAELPYRGAIVYCIQNDKPRTCHPDGTEGSQKHE